MKNITKHIGKLARLRRLPSSNVGNPRWSLVILSYDEDTDGTPKELWICKTQVNSSHGYEAQNYLGGLIEFTMGDHYGVKTLNTIKLYKNGVHGSS